MNFCIDCGKEVSRGPRCRSCAQKHRSKHNFLDKEKIQMGKLYEGGMLLSEIGKIFNCSHSTIRKNLIKFLGEEKYKKIAKEHNRENVKKAQEASATLPRSEKQIDQFKKVHSLPRSEKQIENIKKAQEVAHNLPRSEKQIENIKKTQEVAHNLPRSEKQIENLKKAHNLPRSEKQLKASQENGRKNGRKNIKKAHEALAKGVWISSWEDKFYLKCLTKMFFLKDIERQYYLKGLNHAFDFAIPSQKLLFEIDGNYWHSQNPERDLEIDNFAKSAGWSIFRFNDAKLKELKII